MGDQTGQLNKPLDLCGLVQNQGVLEVGILLHLRVESQN